MKSKIQKFIFLLITISIIFLASCSNPSTTSNTVVQPEQTIKSGFEPKSTGSTAMGDVLIELSPRKTETGRLEVDISANTHSVPLDEFDMEKITVLKINGNTFHPASASVLSGHHASGKIIFDTGAEIPDEFTITIQGIPAVEERIYNWKINGGEK